jgi:ankyrin repeat protein
VGGKGKLTEEQKKTLNASLISATREGNLDEIKGLVEQGADPKVRDQKNDSLLHYAARGGHTEVIQFLATKQKLDVNAAGDKKQTPIHDAAKYSSPEVINCLAKLGADVNVRSDDGPRSLVR